MPTQQDIIKADPLLSQLAPEQLAMIKDYLEKGLMAARFGMNPESVAETVVQKAGQNDMVMTIANMENLVDTAAKLVPAVTEYREWFTDLHEWIKGYLGLPSKFESEFPDETDNGEEQEPNGESAAD